MPYNNEHKAPYFSRARFARLYYIHQQLLNCKYPNVPILAQQLEVCRRTVERDIEHMRDRLGASIKYCPKNKGYYYENKDFNLPPMMLTEGELIAIFLGQKLLAKCAGTPLETSIRSAFEKILSLMPESISVDLNSLDHTISFDVEPIRGDEQQVAEIYSRLAAAVEKKNTIWIKYYGVTRDKISKRYVDPYHLRYYQGAWYLIGYCHLRQDIRIFALDRIQDLVKTTKNFTILPDFSIEDYLSSAIGIELGGETQEVVIRFDAHQARWIRERQWHHTQQLVFQFDGSLILKITVSGLGEVKRWIMGFGSHAEVISPESLRKEIEEDAKRLLSVYKSKIPV